jgi:hypothetical protein
LDTFVLILPGSLGRNLLSERADLLILRGYDLELLALLSCVIWQIRRRLSAKVLPATSNPLSFYRRITSLVL